VVLSVDALVRQQRAPSPYTQPPLPERYRVADDLRRPLADVVAAAEQEATTAPARQWWALADGRECCPGANHIDR
jgi:hypothetical protein